MAKVVFISLPYQGHTNPILPIVKSLVQHGEEVIFFTHNEFKKQVVATGARYRDYGLEEMIPDNKSITMVKALKTLMDVTLVVTDKITETIRQEAPDYIIHDSTAHWGRIIAQKLQVPAVSIFTYFCINSSLAVKAQMAEFKRFEKLVRSTTWSIFNGLPALYSFFKVRRRFNYRPGNLGEIANAFNELNIVLVSRLFQPSEKKFDATHRFVGPSLHDRKEKIGKKLQNFINRKNKLIYIALGSVCHHNTAFYENCIQAFGDTDYDILISCGNRVEPGYFGALPSNIMIMQRVPQLLVLQHTTLFFTHGGMNSVNEGFYYGVPLVVIPQSMDQFIISERIKRLKAGVIINKKTPSPKQLKEALNKVMNNPLYQANAKIIQRSLIASGGTLKAVEEIFRFKNRKNIA